MWHFVNGKKFWLWKAIDGISCRELVNRGDLCCKRLIDRVDDGKCAFATDDWACFYQLLSEDCHFPAKT
ncbi:MAG: hypothetical protein IBJ00_06020 [Alphaproteobacteria bacterium]|nr:hypothetical protein [Alphaproteobacteria bacterium]